MPTATLTSKGQTTIPREVRELLKVKSGDKLEFKINERDNSVSLKAVNIHVSDLKGLLNRSGWILTSVYDHSKEQIIGMMENIQLTEQFELGDHTNATVKSFDSQRRFG
ncbi:MAG TPA: AbrB/MazE/SpoVT family DNA-binding domain-containing protein [Terriglobia bacterium]|jgi:AbrB family looped-hinge helix DNA binding protein